MKSTTSNRRPHDPAFFKAELIIENGQIVDIRYSNVRGCRPLGPRPVVDISAVEYAEGYKLRLTFSDDTAHTVDFEPFLSQSHNPMIRKYLDPAEFAAFSVQGGDLVWHDYDLCFPIADLYEGRV